MSLSMQGIVRGLALSVSLGALSSATYAQSASTASAGMSEPDAPGNPTEIIVTAQKRAEPLLRVPVAVTAIQAKSLIAENRTQLQDYFSQVPGLSLLSSGTGQITIAVRGISTSSSSNPTVGIVIDDVPFGASSVTSYSSRLIPDLDPSDLAQVEVLRGPQGTLYGASSMGGLLKYDTLSPSSRSFSGNIQGDLSSIEKGQFAYGTRAALNVPVSQTFAVRVSAFGRHDAGYVDNVTTGKVNSNSGTAYGGRAAALWTPNDRISWQLSTLLQNRRGNGTPEVEANYLLQPTLGSLQQARIPNTGQYSSKVRLYASNFKADLGAAQLALVTGYSQSIYSAVNDTSPTYGTFSQLFASVGGATFTNQYNTKKFTQEVRFTGSIGDFADILVGGYYGRERTTGAQLIDAVRPADGSFAFRLAQINSHTNLDELAGFGDVTLHLASRFDLQLGGRYASNKQSYPRISSGPLAGVSNTDIHADSNLFTFLVSPQFRISSNAMLYGRVASGYRIGGPNPNAAAGAPPSYKPDKTINYEIGFKGSLFDRMLTIDTSLYYIDWKNIQLSLSNATTGLTYFTNGPRAKSEGVEAAVTLAPRSGLTITANGTYNVAELTENLPTGGGYGLDGDRLPFSSRYAGSLAAEQTFPLTSRLDGFVGGTVTYVGKRYSDFQRTAALVRLQFPHYTTLDLRAGAKLDGWSLNVFATNVTDRRGIIGGSSRGLSATTTVPYSVVYIRPRTVGVSIERKF